MSYCWISSEKNTDHRSIGKKPIHADSSTLNEETESSKKSPKSKLVIEWRLPIMRIFIRKATPKTGQEKYFIWLCVENSSLDVKTKTLNEKVIIWSFYEK